jgi:hypothetical protein
LLEQSRYPVAATIRETARSNTMAFHQWGFIYLGTGSEDPAIDRAVIERGGLTTAIVAVPAPEAAVDAAIELVDAGAQTIELCGAFGPVWTARVIEATGGRVPVGGVTYGPESMHALAALFPQESTV